MINIKNTLMPGKLYKFCYDELEFTNILSYDLIIIKRGHTVLYLGDGSKLKIKVPRYENLYFTGEALFFLIEDKTYVQNIKIISKLEIL